MQNLAQVTEQKVNVQTALMRLVNDDGVIGVEQRVCLRFGQQNAVGHQLDGSITPKAILKTHLVPDHLTGCGVEFFGNALGHAAGGNTSRLGVADQFAAWCRPPVRKGLGVIA